MSYRKENYLKFKKSDVLETINYLDGIEEEDLKPLFDEVLNNGIHGFCYSLYEEGQGPGSMITEEQIRKRLGILKPHTKWIRTFSCTQGNEKIPVIAKELGLKTLVGAWLGDDLEKNELEIQGLIQLANDGFVDIAAVGNEVLYRKELTEDELLLHIERVKKEVNGIPVGYVDAYYEFPNHPRISNTCDVILCNCYPYWEGTHFRDSFQHMRQMYYQAMSAANGKRVIITETGWPSQGERLGGAEPGKFNSMKYFINTNLWSQDEHIDVFYFSSFDEDWKKSAEGEVGAFWGVWDSKGKLKF